MITWALTHIPQLIFLFVLFSVIRAIVRAAQLSSEHKATHSETDEQRRVREIQERIRRIAAERRGGATPPAAEPERPVILRPNVSPLDPFGGPGRRIVREIERRVFTPAPPPEPQMEAAILERQQQLADQMRALQEARETAVRRAANVVENAAAATRATQMAAQRAGWLADLRDPQAVRRAIVLREVLGAPVGLR